MSTTASDVSATNSPGLSGSEKDSSDSGLSESNKKVVIGVVVGVGGALIIGIIGIVIWRMRKGSGNDTDEAADLMSGTAVGTGNREKAPSPAAGSTPFRSTLDQYHNQGPVNAAANF